jgi:ABC-type glutathione transport system ATPase component
MTEPTPRPPSLAHTNVIVPARGLPALVAGRQLIRALAIPQNNIARGTTAMAESMFEMQGIQKRFAGIPALADAALRAGSAEVHALMGRKGAGRSRPNKTLTSNIHGDAGKAQFLDRPFEIASRNEAQRRSLNTIFTDVGQNDICGVFLLAVVLVQSSFARGQRRLAN